MDWVGNTWEPKLKFVLFTALLLLIPFIFVYFIIDYGISYWNVIAGGLSTYWLAVFALIILWTASSVILHYLYKIYNWKVGIAKIIRFELIPSLMYSYFAIFVAYPEVYFIYNGYNPTYVYKLGSGDLINVFAVVFISFFLILWAPFMMDQMY